MTDLPLISNSQTEALLLCERKHFYGYGLELTRVAKSNSLSLGTIIHEMLEHYFNLRIEGRTHEGAIEATKFFALNKMDGTNNEEMAKAGSIFKFFAEANSFDGWTFLAVEKEYHVTLGDFEFQFIVDLVARDPAGKHVVIDHKTTYDFYTDRAIHHMPQLPKYFGGLKALGLPVDYVMYHQLRTREAKSHTVEDKIKLVSWVPKEAQVRQIFNEQIMAAQRIAARKAQSIEEWSATALRVNNNTVCKNCPFANLCVAELEDESPNLILRSEYTKKEKR